MDDARGRVHIYQANPKPGCVITFIFHFTSEEATVDKASISELLKRLTPKQLFDD